MLSDDRPTDPAWLPIFSKKEHFMGNAFGMIPGLETDEWSNDACRGYVIMAMEDCGFSKKDIRRVVGQLYEVFDLNSTCWVPSFDISPRDKWERLAYTRTFAKEVFNDASCHL